MLFEGMIVYCIDKEDPLYGRRLKVEVMFDDGQYLFTDLRTGETIQMKSEQVGQHPPPQL